MLQHSGKETLSIEILYFVELFRVVCKHLPIYQFSSGPPFASFQSPYLPVYCVVTY